MNRKQSDVFLGSNGIGALTWVNEQRELPLTAMPLLFALQPDIEGLLWSNLPLAPDGSSSRALTLVYLFFAEAFWALYAAIAAWLVERSEHRRRLMGVGAGVGAYLLWWNLDHPQIPIILDGHIVYLTKYWPSYAVGVAYVAATGLPLLLSSQRTMFVFGAIVLVVVAYIFYWEALISVWCFFAAASVAILSHFEWSRRSPLNTAGTSPVLE